MAEIMDYLNLYVEEALKEKTNEVALSLENNIKAQLYESHGYDTGNLRRNIRVDSRISKNFSIITGYYDEGNADYGEYVLRGIRGKKEVAPIDFLGDGLERTLEAYR
jgi:hypothetical protein